MPVPTSFTVLPRFLFPMFAVFVCGFFGSDAASTRICCLSVLSFELAVLPRVETDFLVYGDGTEFGTDVFAEVPTVTF